MDNQMLAARLKQHDEQAFEQIIQKYTPLISTIVYNIASGRLQHQDIEEVVTDVFVTLWRNADGLQTDKLHSYLCCIAKSRVKDRLRKENTPVLMDIDEIDESDGTILEMDYENQTLREELRQEIRCIKQPDREILIRCCRCGAHTSGIKPACGRDSRFTRT